MCVYTQVSVCSFLLFYLQGGTYFSKIILSFSIRLRVLTPTQLDVAMLMSLPNYFVHDLSWINKYNNAKRMWIPCGGYFNTLFLGDYYNHVFLSISINVFVKQFVMKRHIISHTFTKDDKNTEDNVVLSENSVCDICAHL